MRWEREEWPSKGKRHEIAKRKACDGGKEVEISYEGTKKKENNRKKRYAGVFDGVSELRAGLPLDVLAEAHEEELLKGARLRNNALNVVAGRRSFHLLKK